MAVSENILLKMVKKKLLHFILNFNLLSILIVWQIKALQNIILLAQKIQPQQFSILKKKVLYKKFPRFGEVCRVKMEKMLGQSQEEISSFINSTPKERYLGDPFSISLKSVG